MTPSIMRLFWDLVNQAHPSQLMRMDDDGLLHWLIEQVQQKSTLDRNQARDLTNYISDRLPLIRDMATYQS
jgi:hypothetical protein